MNKKIIWVLVVIALLGLVTYYVVGNRSDSVDEVMTEDGFVFNEDTYEVVKTVSNNAGAELIFTRNTNLFDEEDSYAQEYKGCGGLAAGLEFSCHLFVKNSDSTPLFIGTLRTIAGINEGTFVSFVNSDNARFSEAGGYDGFEYIDMYNINIKTGEVTKVE